MGSRDRDTKSFQDKFKVFFKKAAAPARNELVVTAELARELSPDTPLPRRLRALRDFTEKAIHQRIQDGGVERVWSCTQDLLAEGAGAEARHLALEALRGAAEGQADRLATMRTVLFRYLRASHARRAPDDDAPRFRLLHTLTNTGKNITCFEEEIGAFLVEWLPQIESAALTVDFLQLMTNVVKFNASSLDDDVVHGIVNNACYLCVYSAEGGVVQGCLQLLEAVVSYSLLPRAALRTFVSALCRTVNIEHYTQNSWKLMRYVVGADIGHAALQQLVELLLAGGEAPGEGEGEALGEGEGEREGQGEADAGLLRGAVFYINMALWGQRRVPTLRVSFLAVLPAFLKAVELARPLVTYEVVLAVGSLVARGAADLHEPAWDLLLDILRAALRQDRALEPPNEPLHAKLHQLLSAVEQLQQAGQYRGDLARLLDLVDSAGHDRPESSAMWVVTQRAAALAPTSRTWAGAALALADRYLRAEPRRALRLHTLHAIHAFIVRHRFVYGDELVERVGVPVLGACALDAEPAVRAAAARALTDLAKHTASDACIDLIDLLEKILNRPFAMYVSDVPVPGGAGAGAGGGGEEGAGAAELAAAALGLRALVHHKLLRAPAAHAARAFLVLLDHLDHHYRRPALLQNHPDIRIKIFEMIFGLRANAFNCVGFCYDEKDNPVFGVAALRLKPVCSPFLLVEPPAVRGQLLAPLQTKDLPPGACVMPAGRAARTLTAALTREADWAVLAHVLRALPPLLQARALAVGRRAQDLDLLASTLCSMVSDRSLYFPECLRVGGSQKLTVSEFHSLALPPLAALAPYHSYLEPQTQQRIVRCLLKYGMVLRSPQPYINALTIFTLETRETMVKMLPEVLLDLSKISDTKLIASPMLEFLSTLTRLPRVFASFVEDQYMSVFAILLPYTNPSRYNHYVVSLAHHVIAAWFLKCRLSYRRNFVRFIIHGLHNYIIMPFEEQLQHRTNNSQPANEDSSNRQRSSSLGSRAVSRAPLGGRGGAGAGPGSASAAFHVELTETCVDLLSRYAFTPCSVKPQRSDTADFIFSGGQSMTWLVGHKLVTITTSGCLQHALKHGLCDRCALLCRQHAAPPPPPPPPPGAAQVQVQVQVNDGEPSAGSQLQPEVKRQNSAENNKVSDPVADALNQFTQRFEKISKEVDTEEAGWSRVTQLVAAGACPCWCANWAEVHVRSPTGDVSWAMRMQNQMNWDYLVESPLQDVAALLSAPSSCSSGLGDSRHDVTSESDPRSRSGSASSPAPPALAQDLHKSSSDTAVSGERLAPHAAASHCILPPQPQPLPQRMSTQPINIPGSPQRQTSSATDEEDMLLIVPPGKSRHPVRRSNSSPEMSSSWKQSERPPAAAAAAPAGAAPPPPAPDIDDMILLPSCEPTSTSQSLHASKKAAKKSDMRVSCEAIPEEMCGTSPLAPLPHHHPHPHQHQHQQGHPHPHLVTYNSDPGTGSGQEEGAEGSAATSHHALQKTASDSTVAAARLAPPVPAPGGPAAGGPGPRDRDDLPPLARSKRSNTISVMSPTRRPVLVRESSGSGAAQAPGAAGARGGAAGAAAGAGGGGVTPSFVFLQLYHNMSTYPITPPVPGETPTMLNPLAERPLRVSGPQHERTIKNLDLVPPVETYKVGVLYVGPGQQDNEVAILRNEYGSMRYAEFLRALGTLVPLDGGEEPPDLFLNLEKGGKDGDYTYVWSDDVMQVLFHVATAMPCSARDPTCNEKRKYIGNDYVSIVYNDSGADFNIHTIKGQFNVCVVVVEPFEHGMNRVFIKTKDERIRTKFLAHVDSHCVSDPNVALLARQVALHCALAAQISQSLKLSAGAAPYASNSLERLRIIKRLRVRAEAERLAAAARAPAPYAGTGGPDLQRRVAIDDFNDYT